MEEIFERVGCPSARLVRCPCPPIDDREVAALIHDLQDEPTFRGVWTFAGDGSPVAILHALDERTFRAARDGATGVLTWNWNHHFGRLLSFTLVVPRQQSPRMFVPDDCALVRAVAERGRIAFAVSHGRQISPFYLADFARHPEHLDMLEAFRALLRFENSEHFAFRDDELAYWLLMEDPKMHWNADLPARDAMRAGWARMYEAQVRDLMRALAELRSCGLSGNGYVSTDAQANVEAVMPSLGEIVNFISASSTTAADALRFACTLLPNPKKMGDLVHGLSVCFNRDVLVDPLKWAVRELLWASLLSPAATLSGLRRPWLDGRNESGDVIVRHIDLNPAALGASARDYWFNFEFNEIFDLGHVVTGDDVPISHNLLFEQLSDLRLDCTEAEAGDAIREILAQARENRQWSAPWGARVQINVGPFKYLDLYELEGEFMGVFRDSAERFMVVSVNVSSGKFSPPMILRPTDDGGSVDENTRAALALVLIVASVVRDFLIVEERCSQFGAKPTKRRRCATNHSLSIIYIPRVRYVRPDVASFHKTISTEIHRTTPHDVVPHLRKAEKSSVAQMLLAKRYGFNVPRGYTFVRPHRRGDAAMQELRRRYRSRSVSAMLYHSLAKAPTGSRPAWFEFEKDVAAALSLMGLQVVHQSASRKGDGGVDIYAYDEAEDCAWAVQCKCYAPARAVGPDVVRELVGSLHRYPEGTRGMIVATSAFTPAAIQEAVALNVRTVDGSQFLELASGTLAKGAEWVR